MEIIISPRFARLATTAVVFVVPIAGSAQTSKPPLPYESLRTFAEVLGAAVSSSVKEVGPDKLIEYAIRGMLQGLDPNSDYLDKEAFSDLQFGPGGAQNNASVGVELGLAGVEGDIQIVSTIEETPASRAGLLPGDIIDRIDSTDLKGMALSKAVKLLYGKPSTDVILTIRRRGEARPREIKLAREIIRLTPVVSSLAGMDIGYVRIRRFNEATLDNFAKQIGVLYKENRRPLRGLVVDLRGNPGGILGLSVGLASAFLPENTTIVRTEGRTEDAKRTFRATSRDYLRTGQSDFRKLLPPQAASVPVVLLINRGTAGGSEVVAAALRDHRRATLIGERSSGRGSVQTILPLGNGTGIKLTTATMITPNGQPIESQGVAPDEVLEQQIVASEYASQSDRAFQRALEILRQKTIS
jgi:carboxyl-terminal processing protease